MREGFEVHYAILKSVLVVAGIFLAIEIGVAVAVDFFGLAVPSSFGAVNTVISTMAGARWFRGRLSRVMSKLERLQFAMGVSIVNAVIPIAFMGVLLMIAGLPVSPHSYDLALAGGHGDLFQPFVAWLLLFVLALVFIQAYFAGWLWTRQRVQHASAID